MWLWSRGEDLITERFPELASLGAALPDGTVIDGEILAWEPGDDAPLPFARLQPRITRKSLTKKVLADSPAALLAYDLLEADGVDLRMTPLGERRARLDALAIELGKRSPSICCACRRSFMQTAGMRSPRCATKAVRAGSKG